MITRSNEGVEVTPQSSKTPNTPAKTRLARLGSSPSKREDKTREDRSSKSSAKDVAELRDYVRIWSPHRASKWDADGFFFIAIGGLLGQRGVWVCLQGVELEYWGNGRCEADKVGRPSQK